LGMADVAARFNGFADERRNAINTLLWDAQQSEASPHPPPLRHGFPQSFVIALVKSALTRCFTALDRVFSFAFWSGLMLFDDAF
jgi:hypothetical protein